MGYSSKVAFLDQFKGHASVHIVRHNMAMRVVLELASFKCIPIIV